MLDSNHLVIVKYHDVKNVERHGQYDFLKLRLTFLEKKKKRKFWKIKAENETSVLNFKKKLRTDTRPLPEGIVPDTRE